jgi:hypothetical protein
METTRLDLAMEGKVDPIDSMS